MSTTASAPHVVNWGIIGTGWISSEFAKDLALEREVDDVYHSVVAVGSRSAGKADKFIEVRVASCTIK
jgi:dihydrodiol dehydrogenase / D-xylose 1-dehydrogenase (NADP)